MKIGVKLRPKRTKGEHDPGHMAVYWGLSDSRQFRGFRFVLDDVPLESREQAGWPAFFLNNAVRGMIFDDIIIRDDLTHHPQQVLCKEWNADPSAISAIAAEAEPCLRGSYSFNPENFQNCNNCVSWAITTVRKILGNIDLQPVRQGRVKLAHEQLLSIGAKPSA